MIGKKEILTFAVLVIATWLELCQPFPVAHPLRTIYSKLVDAHEDVTYDFATGSVVGKRIRREGMSMNDDSPFEVVDGIRALFRSTEEKKPFTPSEIQAEKNLCGSAGCIAKAIQDIPKELTEEEQKVFAELIKESELVESSLINGTKLVLTNVLSVLTGSVSWVITTEWNVLMQYTAFKVLLAICAIALIAILAYLINFIVRYCQLRKLLKVRKPDGNKRYKSGVYYDKFGPHLQLNGKKIYSTNMTVLPKDPDAESPATTLLAGDFVKESIVAGAPIYEVEKLPDGIFQWTIGASGPVVGHGVRVKINGVDGLLTAMHVLKEHRLRDLHVCNAGKCLPLSFGWKVNAFSASHSLDFVHLVPKVAEMNILQIKQRKLARDVKSRCAVVLYGNYDETTGYSLGVAEPYNSIPYYIKYGASTQSGWSGTPIMNARLEVIGVHIGSGEQGQYNIGCLLPAVAKSHKESWGGAGDMVTVQGSSEDDQDNGDGATFMPDYSKEDELSALTDTYYIGGKSWAAEMIEDDMIREREKREDKTAKQREFTLDEALNEDTRDDRKTQFDEKKPYNSGTAPQGYRQIKRNRIVKETRKHFTCLNCWVFQPIAKKCSSCGFHYNSSELPTADVVSTLMKPIETWTSQLVPTEINNAVNQLAARVERIRSLSGVLADTIVGDPIKAKDVETIMASNHKDVLTATASALRDIPPHSFSKCQLNRDTPAMAKARVTNNADQVGIMTIHTTHSDDSSKDESIATFVKEKLVPAAQAPNDAKPVLPKKKRARRKPIIKETLATIPETPEIPISFGSVVFPLAPESGVSSGKAVLHSHLRAEKAESVQSDLAVPVCPAPSPHKSRKNGKQRKPHGPNLQQ